MNNDYNYTPQNDSYSYQETEPTPPLLNNTGHAKGFSIAALVLGIVSIFLPTCCCCCCLYYIAPVLSAAAIVMACLARRDNGQKMPTMALVGLILAILGIVVFLAVFISDLAFRSISQEEFIRIFDEFFKDELGMTYEEFINTYPQFNQ